MALLLPSTATVRSFQLLAASAEEQILTPATKPTLAALFAAAPVPWTLAAFALALGVDPILLDRVAVRRQPLPRLLAARMAAAAGLQLGDVEAVVDIVALETPVAYRPAPADRAWGDALDFVPLARTVEVVPG